MSEEHRIESGQRGFLRVAGSLAGAGRRAADLMSELRL